MSLVIVVTGLYFIFKSNEITHPPGILIAEKPIQSKIVKKNSWVSNSYQFTPLYNMELRARVLGKKYYGSDKMSEFCQIDLALGWGPMSDQAILDNIDIKQQHRWYVWHTDNFPIPRKEIENNSANMHIIPADESIETELENIIKGNLISIEGKLVNVNKLGEKFIWKSSTKRSDTGSGACEIIWVEHISMNK